MGKQWNKIRIVFLMIFLLLLAGCGKPAGGEGSAENRQGFKLYEDGNYQEAADAFGKAIEKEPDCAEYYINQAMAQIGISDLAGAKASVAEAARLDGENPYVLRASGIVALEEGNYGEAQTYLTKALDAAGKDKAFQKDVYLYRAEAALKSENYQGAIDDYSALIALDQKEAEYYFLRGCAYAKSGNATGMEADFATVRKLSPKEMGYYLEMSRILDENGFSEAAADCLEETLSKKARSEEEKAVAYYQVALRRMEAEDYAGALEAASEGISLGETSVSEGLAYTEAACYEYLGDFQTALEKFIAYRDTYGSNETLEHEIAFLQTRVQ